MKKLKNTLLIGLVLFAFSSYSSFAQEKYEFNTVVDLETSSVKSQGRSGTCWCYATTSFLETELIRMGQPEYDLSEMFLVHHAYLKKAKDYVRYHGKNNFGQGGQAHDAILELKQHGIVPEEAYSGIQYDSEGHNHYEMASVLKAFVDEIANSKRLTPVWHKAYGAILESYLGKLPENFEYEGKSYSPKSFQEMLELNPEDYIELTSYTHHDYYKTFVLEVPDNWSHDLYYNLPLNDLMRVMETSLKEGYSVVWDGDVSSKGYAHEDGVAVVPEDTDIDTDEDFKTHPVEEKNITPEMRQQLFNNFTTTDDHLMHLTGISVDQNGTRYYKTKNSWSDDSNDFGGFLFMSDAFMRLNTIAIMIHKDALPEDIAEKLNIE